MKRLMLFIAFGLCACAGDTTAPLRQAALLSAGPTFLRFQPDAYENAQRSGSFWAVEGESRSISLRYGDNGAEFLRFQVGPNSLLRYPDGSRFAQGDSVRIDVAVADDGTMRFRFEPSGLAFNPDEPAELRIQLHRADLDPVEKLLSSIWKQDLPGLPWIKLPTVHLSTDVVESNVAHFTEFGMAVN